MKLTRHNGRAGKNGAYNPKHNDRSFDIENSEHIDAEKVTYNLYWDCYNGFTSPILTDPKIEMASTFEEVEQKFYVEKYQNYIEGQNARNIKNRHPERNRTTEDIRKHKKTCPEETIYQIGTMENHIDARELVDIANQFFEEFQLRFGSNIHLLDWALHVDEGTPHIHERHVFDCENDYGEIFPQQEKALEALGFELPDPEKKAGRYNNRKMVFDAACRTILFDICKEHGLHLDEEPSYGGRAYLEKQDYIRMKQQETIKEQEEKIEELTMKLSDVDALIDEVCDLAYDEAVEAVTDEVVLQTLKDDIERVESSKRWVQAPERKASKKEKEYALARLDGVIRKFKNAMSSTMDHIKERLMKAEVKQKAVEQIKQTAKPSIMKRLEANRQEVAQREAARKQTTKKHNMEL